MPKIMHGGVEYGGSGNSISNLTDVELTDLSDGQILKYDSTIQKWVNANKGGGGREYIGSLIDRVSQSVGNISASSYDGSFGEAWKAFNGVSPTNLRNPDNVWLPTQNEANPWIQYDFGLENERYFTQISIKCFSNYSGAWTGYIDILGSNDGVTWENILATGDKVSVTANYQQFTEIDIDLDDTSLWRYIRLRGESAFNIYYQPAFIIDEIYVYGGIEKSGGDIDPNSHLNYQYTLDSISVNPGVTEDLGQILLKSDHDVEGKLAIFQGATISSITDSNNNVYNGHYIHELGVFVTDACIINTQNSWDDEIVYTTFRLVNNSSLTIVSCTISFMLSWI